MKNENQLAKSAMKSASPPATAMATATSLVALTEQRAAQAKKALKQAKTRFKSAKRTLKQARKASRRAAKLARKARHGLDELQAQIPKAKKAAPPRQAKVRARPAVKPATFPKPAASASQTEGTEIGFSVSSAASGSV